MARATALRRWLTALVGIVLTASCAAGALLMPPLKYQATSQVMLLLPPTGRSTRVVVNPFLYQPNGLVTLARSAIVEPRGEGFRQSMVEAGFTASFELDAEILAPVVRFSTEGRDPANVNATMAELRRRFDRSVHDAQIEEGVPARQFAHLVEMQSISAVPISGDRLRASIGMAAVGALLTILATSAVRGHRPSVSSNRRLHPRGLDAEAVTAEAGLVGVRDE